MFDIMSDDKNALSFLSPKFNNSNQLSSVKSHILEKQSFEPVKLFTLDVELSAVPGKTSSDKLISIKRIFYRIDGFGGAFTPSKFLGIIRSFFTSKLSLNMVKKLAVREKILVNNVIRKPNSHSNQKVIIKKILVDFPKLAVESVFFKFGKIVSIKMQLIGLWQKALVEFESPEIASSVASKWLVLMSKDFVQMALAINDKQSWILRDQHQALLYTLPVGTTAHNLSGLLESYGGKTCFIGHNPSSYVRDRCIVICFENKASKLAAVGFVLIFKDVNLCWTSLFLACLCSVGGNSGVCEKWVAQVAGGILSCVISSIPFGADQSPGAKTSSFASASSGNPDLYDYMASLECFLGLLADQISGILKKLSFVDLVFLAVTSEVPLLVVLVCVVFGLNSDMTLDGALVFFIPLSPAVNNTVINLSSSSSKVLTTKVGDLESKMLALEISVESVLEKLNCLCSNLDSSTLSSSQ
ncbi:hypothetical protein G9A89_020609 [Geosiphon pyriformis]|nr:hypothetical protein G9A89_020609 [Geosiphon pyriformis]